VGASAFSSARWPPSALRLALPSGCRADCRWDPLAVAAGALKPLELVCLALERLGWGCCDPGVVGSVPSDCRAALAAGFGCPELPSPSVERVLRAPVGSRINASSPGGSSPERRYKLPLCNLEQLPAGRAEDLPAMAGAGHPRHRCPGWFDRSQPAGLPGHPGSARPGWRGWWPWWWPWYRKSRSGRRG